MEFAREKDLDKRYGDIYKEKMEQYWRFTEQNELAEADDSNLDDSESEEASLSESFLCLCSGHLCYCYRFCFSAFFS